MAIEIVDFPIKQGGSFHSYVNVYQRVSLLSPYHMLSVNGPQDPSRPLISPMSRRQIEEHRPIAQRVDPGLADLVHPAATEGVRGSAVPSGKRLHSYGKSPFLMGKSTISTGPFSRAMLVYQGVNHWKVMMVSPSWKMMDFINGKDDSPYMKWKIKVMFQTTNQMMMMLMMMIIIIILLLL